MSLFESISSDMKSAMKSGERARVDVLRFVLAGLQGVQKEKNVKEPGVALTDAETIAILQKEAKRRKEAIELFKQGKREDLVTKESADLVIIQSYLPKELSEEEIGKVIDGLREQGFADFNMLMRESMKVLKGKADGKIVGEVIKKKIS